MYVWVFVFMCVCIHVCMGVSVCMCALTYTCGCMRVYSCVFMHMHGCVSVYVCAFMCTCGYMCAYVYSCVYMGVSVCALIVYVWVYVYMCIPVRIRGVGVRVCMLSSKGRVTSGMASEHPCLRGGLICRQSFSGVNKGGPWGEVGGLAGKGDGGAPLPSLFASQPFILCHILILFLKMPLGPWHRPLLAAAPGGEDLTARWRRRQRGGQGRQRHMGY